MLTDRRGVLRVGRPRSRLSDIEVTDDLGLVLSPQATALLRSLGATGWTGEPVTVLRSTEEVVGYERLHVTGRSPRLWSGFHDDHVREERWAPHVPWVAVHACTDPAPDGWDGSDVFSPAGTQYVVVTDRVRQAFGAAGLRAEFEQVGRLTVPLFQEDDEDRDTEAEWRARTGTLPGQRAGTALCPDLLGEPG